MAKVLKNNKKGITKFLINKLSLNQNIEQLYYYFIAFVMINHLSACFWFYIAKLSDFDNDTWVTRLGFNDVSAIEVKILYLN